MLSRVEDLSQIYILSSIKEEKLRPSAKALSELAAMNKRSINPNPIPWKQQQENCLNLLLDGYKSHFNSVGPGKGLAVYFKEDIFEHVQDVKKDNMQLTKLKSSRMDIIAVYRSEQGNSSELLEHIKELITPEKNTIICGDFNICYFANRRNRVSKYLEENGFTQLVKEATHIQGRLLDHFYMRMCNNEQQTSSVYRYSPYYVDHDAICTTVNFHEH